MATNSRPEVNPTARRLAFPWVFHGVPPEFEEACEAARRGGRRNGYAAAGRVFARHLARYVRTGVSGTSSDKLQVLETAALNGDRPAVLDWLTREFPDCLPVVPTAHRARFLDGVIDCIREEDGILVVTGVITVEFVKRAEARPTLPTVTFTLIDGAYRRGKTDG